jgi:methionyl-tRNA formyltransferase
LLEVLPAWYEGALPARPQNEEGATYTELLTKDSGNIDWALSAKDLERRVRAFVPWPVAFSTWSGGVLRIFAAEALPASDDGLYPLGAVVHVSGDGIEVQTGDGRLSLCEVQPAGGKRMPAADFVRGRPEIRESRFSAEP